MAHVLGTSTLSPNALGEQSINVGILPTWVNITVTGSVSYPRKSEGKATAGYQHCQPISPVNSENESGYIVRVYNNFGTLVATAKLKSFTGTHINLKEISVSGSHQMLIEAGN